MTSDAELLRQFVDAHSETAFTELVRRRIDFVYGLALRQVGGDAHLASDVAQGVFLDLARKARRLSQRNILVSWLYTSTRFAAAKAVRTQSRWLQHQQEAHTMEKILSGNVASEPNWTQLRPVLEGALEAMGEKDRAAILLRYFEGRPMAEVGASLGVAENAARMRVDRALEKLRGHLARRGITSTAAALGALLVSQPLVAAPAGLAAHVAGSSLAGAAAGSGALAGVSFLEFMSSSKLAFGVVGLAAILSLASYSSSKSRLTSELAAEERQQNAQRAALRAENLALRKGTQGVATVPSPAMEAPPPAPDPVARSRAAIELIQSGLLGSVSWSLDTSVFDAGTLVTEFASVMGLNAADSAAMVEATRKTQSEIAADSIARAVIERAENQIVITFPMSDAAQASVDRLDAMLTEKLDAEASAYFKKSVRSTLDASLAHISGGLFYETRMTLSRYVDSVTQSFRYRYESVRIRPKGGEQVGASSPGSKRSELKQVLGPLEVAIPVDF